ncbi:MAG: rubrerythrin family protein [Deltaproteobacteria bacterium]|nr:rubrerythrin family protein [Deltaproteobacteria bacterium]
MEVRGTRTETNLMAAFAGESQARNRYTYFAGVARKAGLEQISAAFLETADHEKEHAKRFYSFLADGASVQITASFPKILADTAANLQEAAAGENMEWTTLYPGFAQVADQEGFAPVADLFRRVCVAERQHEQRYLGFLRNLREGRIFEREAATLWVCRNCGYVHEGPSTLDLCPACAHPKAYFELLAENW